MTAENRQQAFHTLGDASFYMTDYHFNEVKEKKYGNIRTYYPPAKAGQGSLYQVQPTDGIFLSVSDWIPYHDMERRYQIEHKMIKMYYLESGEVQLIQNGKRTAEIQEGIHLYLNSPSKGRVLYRAGIPLRYISVLLLEDYFLPFLQSRYASDGLDYAALFSWREFDYNTPEIGRIFLQIKDKILSGETSRLYYESKVGELLSVAAGNAQRQKQQANASLNRMKDCLSPVEQKALERARLTIERSILNPPSSEELCSIAAMGHTKFRRTFQLRYGLSPRDYILRARMHYACLLLSKPALSIGVIAAHLGYASAGKFSIAFRKVYHHSPAQYRAAIRK